MDGRNDDGKKNMVNFYGDTKSSVLQQLRDYQNSLESNVHLDKTTAFAHYAQQWYEDYETHVEPSTYSSYGYTLRILTGHFGNRKLGDIVTADINRFLTKRVKDKCSASQISKCRTMLIQIFDSAESNNLILRNPARRSKIPRNLGGGQVTTREAFTTDEVSRMMVGLPNNLLGNSIRLMLCTGLRTQEVLALTPNDIAKNGSAVVVNKAIKTVNGVPTLGKPKSARSNRTVPVPTAYHQVACNLRGTDDGNHVLWKGNSTEGLTPVGTFRRQFYRALATVDGVTKRSPHCCRHSYVTWLQANGTPMELIARLAGHSDIATTDGYLHTTLETLSGAVIDLHWEGGDAS